MLTSPQSIKHHHILDQSDPSRCLCVHTDINLICQILCRSLFLLKSLATVDLLCVSRWFVLSVASIDSMLFDKDFSIGQRSHETWVRGSSEHVTSLLSRLELSNTILVELFLRCVSTWQLADFIEYIKVSQLSSSLSCPNPCERLRMVLTKPLHRSSNRCWVHTQTAVHSNSLCNKVSGCRIMVTSGVQNPRDLLDSFHVMEDPSFLQSLHHSSPTRSVELRPSPRCVISLPSAAWNLTCGGVPICLSAKRVRVHI